MFKNAILSISVTISISSVALAMDNLPEYSAARKLMPISDYTVVTTLEEIEKDPASCLQKILDHIEKETLIENKTNAIVFKVALDNFRKEGFYLPNYITSDYFNQSNIAPPSYIREKQLSSILKIYNGTSLIELYKNIEDQIRKYIRSLK